MLSSLYKKHKIFKIMRKLKRRVVTTNTTGKSKTHQSERDNADIKNILKKGIMPPDPNQMTFGDFSNGRDFQQTQDAIAQVKSEFDELPSEVRYRFRNDPGLMLDFLADPNNHEDAVEMGLRPKPEREVQEPTKGSTEDSEQPKGRKKSGPNESSDDKNSSPSTSPS